MYNNDIQVLDSQNLKEGFIMSKGNDDLTKVKQDGNFVNCHQTWEKDNLKKQGHSEEAINHCCSQDMGNNPRGEFEQCLVDFEKTKTK